MENKVRVRAEQMEELKCNTAENYSKYSSRIISISIVNKEHEQH